MLEPAPLETLFELPLDIPLQYRTLYLQMGHERGVACFDNLVKEGEFRAIAVALLMHGVLDGRREPVRSTKRASVVNVAAQRRRGNAPNIVLR